MPPLAVPDELEPQTGEIALAVRLIKHSSGYIRRRIAGAGLVRSEAVAGWVGVLPEADAEDLARRVVAAGGSVAQRG